MRAQSLRIDKISSLRWRIESGEGGEKRRSKVRIILFASVFTERRHEGFVRYHIL
jgi:hypothetical protein